MARVEFNYEIFLNSSPFSFLQPTKWKLKNQLNIFIPCKISGPASVSIVLARWLNIRWVQ